MQYIYSWEKKVALGELANPGVLGKEIILLSTLSLLPSENKQQNGRTFTCCLMDYVVSLDKHSLF